MTLPDMPLILTNDLHVNVPLEPTYLATWSGFYSRRNPALAVETGGAATTLMRNSSAIQANPIRGRSFDPIANFKTSFVLQITANDLARVIAV